MTDPLRVRLSVVPGRSHNLYHEYFDLPPRGVAYSHPAVDEVGYKPARDERPTLLHRLRDSPRFRAAYGPILRGPLGGLGVKDRLSLLRRQDPGYDLYHSVGSVHARPEPWVISFESSLDFFSFGPGSWREEMKQGGSRAYVRRKLLSRWCRAILPETDAARRSVLQAWPDDAKTLDAKMEVVQLALRAGPEPPPARTDGAKRLLFVGSRNFPKDFIPKGGHLVLATYARLREERDDVELVVRSIVPEKYRARFGDVPGLRILDGELPGPEVERLYQDAHVFMFPGSSTPGMVIREAMRAAKPVVTIDAWANAELVEDGKTGYVVKAPHGTPYTNAWGALNWSHEPSFLDPFETNVEETVAQMVERTRRLLDDADLRARMGRAGRQEIVSGKLSIGVRNAKLERIYADAARG